MGAALIFGDKNTFAVEVAHVARGRDVVHRLLDDGSPDPVPQKREFLVGGVRIWVGGKYFGQIDEIVPLGIPAGQIENWIRPGHIPVCKNRKRLLKNMKLDWGRVAERFRLRVELGETTDDFCISTFRSAGYVWFYWMPGQWRGHLYRLNRRRVAFERLCSVALEFMTWEQRAEQELKNGTSPYGELDGKETV